MQESGAHILDAALSPTRVFLTDLRRKEDVLNHLIHSMAESGEVRDLDAFRKGIFAREDLMSTGIGLGVGVPHARISSVSRMVMAAAVNKIPLPDYDSIDSQPVRIVFLVAGRPDQQSQYVRLLAALSRVIKDVDHREAMLNAVNAEDLYNSIRSTL